MSLDAPKTQAIDGRGFAVGIAAARFNGSLVDALLENCTSVITAAGATVETVRVPGSHEVPVAAQALARTGRFHAIIGLGVIIRGGTIHYDVIAHSSAEALQRVALDTGLPVINGIITAENRLQADERCRGETDRGAEFGHAALEMAALFRGLQGAS
jgi:6,7-dimethyl-8-ribityllumazine synthase